jgi:tRNA 2-thiouridine synthesizing protein B
MSTLHLVRQSAFATNDFAQCLNVVNQHDAIVLMDDGCYNVNHTLINNLLKQVGDNINLVASHAKARAIEANKMIKLIEMVDVVTLAFIHSKVITWQ